VRWRPWQWQWQWAAYPLYAYDSYYKWMRDSRDSRAPKLLIFASSYRSLALRIPAIPASDATQSGRRAAFRAPFLFPPLKS
jgi:hypothetical protein